MAATDRIEALDGLRGVAVAAVVVHHAEPDWLPGGWLGVDVFFVLSGFLITTLLVEHSRTLRDFWARRVRRLVPALVPVLGALAVWASVADDRVRFRGLRGDGLASLGSVVNWRFVAQHESYFDRFSEPSLVRHLWSLSVEGQFYLVWPLVLAVLLRGGRRSAAALTLGLAAASAVAMLALSGDVTRAYFGTDTHAHGLLLGAALALAVVRLPAFVGWAGLAVLAASFALVEDIAWTPLVGVATVLVVASAADLTPLRAPPLVALGRISYAVYLWHWPLLQLLDDEPLVVPLALTLALAVTSWYVIERPVLRGRLRVAVAPAALGATALALAVLAVPVRAPEEAAAEAALERAASDAPAAPAETVVDGRMLVVGDSVAYTLFPGLRAYERDAGLEFFTATQTGCPLDIDAFEFVDDSGPVGLNPPSYCDWRTTWPPVVERTRPEVVVALWGLWDTGDHVVDGRLLQAGTPEWTQHMTSVFEEAVGVLTRHGARVVVLSTPYVHSLDPARVDALNGVFRAVAERNGGTVTVVDTAEAIAHPDAERWDAVHFTEAGANVVAAQIVPTLGDLAAG